MKTQFIFFPFDLFGSAGTAQGVHLIAKELEEILDDNEHETVPTRADAYSPHVEVLEDTFENFNDYQTWRARGRELAQECLKEEMFLFWISGNHLGALPLYEEIAQTEGSLIVQLDAHLDVHHFEDCTTELSHGNFLLHAERELPEIINVGHRELLLMPDYVSTYFSQTFPITDVVTRWPQVLEKVKGRCQQAEKVWLDIDCDCLDPHFFPAVKTPVPMGMTPQQLLMLVETIGVQNLAGVMISEFAPDGDQNDRSLSTLMWLIEYLLVERYEEKA